MKIQVNNQPVNEESKDGNHVLKTLNIQKELADIIEANNLKKFIGDYYGQEQQPQTIESNPTFKQRLQDLAIFWSAMWFIFQLIKLLVIM